MKGAKILSVLILSILFVNLTSSVEIILNNEPSGTYNLGDSLEIPVKVVSNTNVYGKLVMNLLCNGKESSFYQNGVMLSAGEEHSFESILILDKNSVRGLNGTCKIKAILGEEFKLTETFEVSNSIEIDLDLNKSDYLPGEKVEFIGGAKTKSGRNVGGFISIGIKNGSYDGNLNVLDSVRNGFFRTSLEIPEEMPSENYVFIIEVYEKNNEDEKTNRGYKVLNLNVKQVPTDTEVITNSSEVKPGKKFLVKVILHDQSGEKINSTAIIEVKTQEGEIIKRFQEKTGENTLVEIPEGEKPGQWSIEAESEGLKGKANLEILEYRKLDLEILNGSVIVENVGNIPYNKSLFFQVGNKTITLDLNLPVGGKEDYLLTAPDGVYDVEVSLDEGVYTVNNVPLTGNAIGLREASEGLLKLSRQPSVWFFVIFLLLVISFIIFKKGYEKSFVGNFKKSRKNKSSHLKDNKQSKNSRQQVNTQNTLTGAKSNAYISLSMKGDKQSSSVVCFKIKNFGGLFKQNNTSKDEEGSPSDTIKKITEMAEKYKASVYENNENIFFILAPIRTRTFVNEKIAFNLANEIKKYVDIHNKRFNTKISYGLGIDYGEIIAKKEDGKIKFMSIGSLIPDVKKVALASKGEVLIGQSVKKKFADKAKTELIPSSSKENPIYRIKEMRDREQHSSFINQFVQRQKREANNKK